MSLNTARRMFGRPVCRRTFATTLTHRALPDLVRIIEVGPRDGLQNEKDTISPETKIELINRLARTGLQTIEAGSFVAPKWVPQMAASDKVLSSVLTRPPPSPVPVTYQWLLPNSRGLENFLNVMDVHAPPASAYPTPPPSPAPNISSPGLNPKPSSVDTTSQAHHPSLPHAPRHEVSIFMAATESFSARNTNCSIAESLTRFAPLMASARAAGYPVRAYISVALGCPFEGAGVDPHRVAALAATLLEMGAGEISVADTTGMGTAVSTQRLLKTLQEAGIRAEDLALHFHDTFGQALVNTVVALEHGVRTFDAAVGGLGGCPYSPGATGNVATEDLVYCLQSLGAETGVDLDEVSRIGDWITGELGKGNASSAGRATMARLRRAAAA